MFWPDKIDFILLVFEFCHAGGIVGRETYRDHVTNLRPNNPRTT